MTGDFSTSATGRWPQPADRRPQFSEPNLPKLRRPQASHPRPQLAHNLTSTEANGKWIATVPSAAGRKNREGAGRVWTGLKRAAPSETRWPANPDDRKRREHPSRGGSAADRGGSGARRSRRSPLPRDSTRRRTVVPGDWPAAARHLSGTEPCKDVRTSDRQVLPRSSSPGQRQRELRRAGRTACRTPP